MGKEDKEDSGFGFKDRAKAEETLKLLEQHEMNYRRLTVRGLLGRAKRVLSLTKAEDKIKNIKEAMEVFENWLADLDKNGEKKQEKEKKPAKKEEKNDSDMEDSPDLPSESVSGLGFKDAAAAENSLKVLEGRDPDYQLLAVKGLIGRAKRVLTCTKDETKLGNIKEAMSVLEKFVDDFEKLHLSRQNNPYLSLGVVRTAHALAGDVTELQRSFLEAYASVNGEYKRLRNVPVTDADFTWDIVRNKELKVLKEKHANAKLFNEKDEPTKEHLELLVWAYSPEAAKVKKVVKETKEEKNKEEEKKERKRQRSSDSGGESPNKKGREE